MQGAFFLDVVVRKRTIVLQRFSSKDQTLLIGRNTFFILDLSLDVLNAVGGLNVKGDRFPCEGFDKYLHILWSETENDKAVDGSKNQAQNFPVTELSPSVKEPRR